MNRFGRVVLIAVLLIGMSGTPSSATRATPVLDKIASWVLEHTADGAEAEFLVVLAAQADLSEASRLQTKAEKGRYVYETLWRTAQASQAPLRAWLEARGVEHRAYYIVNLIWVKGDAILARTLAARPDVARIEGNPTIRNPLPQPARPFDRLLANAPTGIESNITYVRAPEVWAMGFTGQGIVVGGQDTGYDWTHPALQPHYRGWDGVTADHDYNWHDSIHSGGGSCGADSPVPCDDYSHGTHTMGTVVGDDGGDNQIGMAPGAQWIGCRNMDVGDGTPATYLECFEFFLAPYPVGGTPDQGDPSKAPDVTNNSWTCPSSEGCSWSTLQAAVEAQRAAGIMTVVSAGNGGSSCSTIGDPPAIYAAAYTVGALYTGTDTIASLSSRGPVTVDGSNRRKPDITAPGTNVRSCVLNGTYGYKTGTSMAAPHVAGAVALLWSAVPAFKNQITATEQLLNDYAFHINSTACSSSGWPNNVYGYGRLDIKAAVDAVLDYGVALVPAGATQHGAPGQAVSTTFHITNTGTAVDSFTITLAGAHWETVAPEQLGPLSPDATALLPVTVTIPADAPCEASDSVTVTVTSAGDPTQRVQATLRTTADAVYAVAVRAAESGLGAMPGASVGTTVWVTNTGNCTDTFAVDSVAVWPVSVPDTTGVLATGVGGSLPVTVTVPLSASFGMVDVTTLTATSQANSTVSATAQVTTTAGAVYGVQLWPPEIMANGDVGKTVIYTLTLTNTGNITDVYSLALSRATWPTTLTPTLATLAPQATAPVTALVTVPWDVFTGITDTARVTASGTGASAYSDLTTAAIAAGCIPVVDPHFTYAPSHPLVGQMITFTGEVALGTQPVDYVWDFGDGSPVAYGQSVTHTFPAATAMLPYTVIMTAINECSEETVQRIVTVESYRLYLPLIIKSSGTVFIPMQAPVSAIEYTAPGDPQSGPSPDAAPTFQDGGPWVVRAYYTDVQMVRDLAAWNEPWEVQRDARYVVVEVDADAYARLLAAGFRVEIDASLTTQLRQPNVMLPDQVAGIPGYPCYRTVEETFATAEAIVAAYPDLATWIDIGDSWEKTAAGVNPGYDLMVLRLTNSTIPGPKPKLFVMSSVHAREYTPAELNTRFAEYLVEHYSIDADVTWVLDYHEIHLLLQANPDGRKQAETGLSWRKNTNENYCSPTSNYRGADLNRNFGFQWGCCNGSSPLPCELTYRGPTPASEPETQAVQDYVRAQFPDQRADDLTAAAPLNATGIFLDVHSYSELVLWSWGFTEDPPPNSAGLQTLGRKFAYFNGYMPQQAMALYPTDGTTDDFAYGELGLAAYTFELGTAFFQSCTAFENTIVPTNIPALLYAAKAARTPYITPSGPETLDVTVIPTGTLLVPLAQVSATIDDTRYSSNNGIEPTQNITAAEYYVDVPPWDDAATAHPMTAADGSFDAPVEVVTAMLHVAGLSAGRHTLYVRGQDADGNWGVVSAAFVTVSDSLSWPYAVYLPVVTQE
ncbi:MAG: M14 family zinc carboxypeptidase [Anaerolineae bacterium]